MSNPQHSDSRKTSASPPLEPDAVIEHLAVLAERATNESDFYRALVRELVRATGGYGAAVWTLEAGNFRLVEQLGMNHSLAPAPSHRTRLDETLSGNDCRVFRDESQADAVEILCPWRVDEVLCGVVELRQKADISAAALAGQQRFVNVIAELIRTFHRSARTAETRGREQRWLEIDRFAQEVHRPVDLEATAYAVANEGRRLANCDRLTVLVRRRQRWKAVAVSGSDNVNRRSSTIAHLELLASLVATHNRPVWSGAGHEAPPELEEPLDDYHDVSSSRLLGLMPLSLARGENGDEGPAASESFAVLVFERFDEIEPADLADRCDAVCRHGANALHRSLVHEEMPLRGLSRLLDRSAWVKRIRRQPLALLSAGLLAAILPLLAAVPVPLRVEATGSLQPRTQRHLFAPADAVVERLLVREAGEDVSADQELIQLRDPELQYEIERVLGELETARKQLAGIEAERIRTDRASRSDVRDAALRSAEEESLKKQLEGLQRQQELLETRREKLSLRSPIDGQLLTWDAEQLLRSRPVGRGQILLTVADLRGAWVLELEIPDDRIADVAKAVRDQEELLDASFILATAPETRYSGKLESIAPATDVRSDRGPTVFAVVRPDDQATVQTLRPGASVIAKIDCGRRSLLYVMTRGLLRAIRSRVLF